MITSKQLDVAGYLRERHADSRRFVLQMLENVGSLTVSCRTRINNGNLKVFWKPESIYHDHVLFVVFHFRAMKQD